MRAASTNKTNYHSGAGAVLRLTDPNEELNMGHKQATVYMTNETELSLRHIAERENLRSPRGELSISATVRWLAQQYEKRTKRMEK